MDSTQGQRARLGVYLYVAAIRVMRLERFNPTEPGVLPSDAIGWATGINPTQVRRDLAAVLGHAGKRGVGYRPNSLVRKLHGRLAERGLAGSAALLIGYCQRQPERFEGDEKLERLVRTGARVADEIERLLMAETEAM